MKKAYTLIELLFVIVIIGIMVGVGSTSIKTNYLINDVNFISGKIRQAQYQAIGYSKVSFGSTAPISSNIGCITLNKTSLDEKNFKIHSTLSEELKDKTLCFDSKGAPTITEKLLQVQYKGETAEIKIEHITGYVIIIY